MTKQNGAITPLQVPGSCHNVTPDTQEITRLEDPKKVKEWKTVETHPKIAFYLKLCYHFQFGQVHGTLFTVSPLSMDVD